MTDIIAQTGPDHPAPVILHALARPFASDVIRAAVPHGRTVAEILTAQGLLRQACEASVWVDDWHIPQENWHKVRPGPGRTLSVRVLPAGGGGGGGKSVLRVVATIAIMYAAFQLAPVLAPELFPGLMAAGAQGAATAVAMTTSAIAMTGSLLLNALMPIPKPRMGQMEQRYSIGASNQARPYGLLPVPLGTQRWAPPYAARPYTELVGTDQYVRILFDLGPGPLSIDQASMRLGDTPLSDYKDIELEIREGRGDDAPITLMPGRVLEIGAGSGLPAGIMEAKNGWIVRVLDQEADELSLDFSYPAGVSRQTSSGKRKTHTAGVQIAYAPENSEDWRPFPGGTYQGHMVTAQSESEIRVSYRVAVPRGRYKVRALRVVDNTGNSQYVDQVAWTAARAQLNESPVTPRVPHAFVAMRVRASGQLSGTVNDFNLITTRVAPDWDGTNWVERPTRNPASLALWVLRGGANQRPYADRKIDWPAWQDFHTACATTGRIYDCLLETPGTVFDAVRQICAVGRGQFTIRDTLLSVMRDRQQETPVALISPRNSRNFSLTRVFADIPHALRVRYKDAAADYQDAERIVFDDGYDESNATLYEVLELPGVTSADLAWKDGRYHLAQLRLRPAIYEVDQDFEHLIVQRGDRVDLQHDVMLTGLAAGRVKSISADRMLMQVDELCPMQAGRSYVVRLRTAAWHVLDLPVTTVPGDQQMLAFTTPVPAAVAPDDLFTFGEAGAVTVPAIVKSIRPGADLSARLELVDYAAGIYSAEQGAIPPYDPGIRIDRLPAVEGLTVREIAVWSNGIAVPAIAMDWDRSQDARVEDYAVYLRDPTGIWTAGTASRRTGHDVTPAAIGTWLVRVQALSPDGRRGPMVEASLLVDGIPDYLPPAGLTATPTTTLLADGSVSAAIAVNWTAYDSASLLSVVIRWREVGTHQWQQVVAPWGAAQQLLSPVRQPALYEIQAASSGMDDVRSDWSEVIQVALDGGMRDARVVGLELFEQGPDTDFEGPDVRLVWNGAFPDTVPAPGEENYGLGTGPANPYLAGYVVCVYDVDTGALIRTESPKMETEYVYRYDDNKRDGGPRRRLRFTVSIAPKTGPEVGTAQIIVANPRPGLPQALTATPVFGGARIRYAMPTDTDWTGCIVAMGAAADFPPVPTSWVYRGPDTGPTVAIDPGVTRYIRVALTDAFGDDDLQWSRPIAVKALHIKTADLANAIIGEDKLTAALNTRLTDGDANVAALQVLADTHSDELGHLSASYTVKVDVAGRVAGFGLASEANNGPAVSHFAVVADKFSVARPGGGPDKYVFTAGTHPDTGEPTLVLSGVVYADTINANQINAGEISPDRIGDGSLSFIKIANDLKSTNYKAGISGWRIDKAGSAEFNGIVLSRPMIVHADVVPGSSGSYTIAPADGWTMLGSWTFDTGFSVGAWHNVNDRVQEVRAGITQGDVVATIVEGDPGPYLDWTAKVKQVYARGRWAQPTTLWVTIEFWAQAYGTVTAINIPGINYSIFQVT